MSPAAATTVRTLDNRIDELERDFVDFKARIELVISLLKWTGGFVVITLVAVITQLISISYSAGRLQEKVDTQTTAIKEVQADFRQFRNEVHDLLMENRKLQDEILRGRKVTGDFPIANKTEE